jgi:hypothetical protein
VDFFTTDARSADEIETYLIFFEPKGHLQRLVRTPRDVYDNRTILKQIPCDEYTVGYIARIILEALHSGKPFRFVDCVKVLRTLIASAAPLQFSPSTVEVLFEIYRAKIFSVNEQTQWHLSRIVKGQFLDEDAIGWLLKNWQRSDHIVNRLLGYPERHPMIVAWAREMYAAGRFPERTTDLLAILIDHSVPLLRPDTDPASVIWAIFRSRSDDTTKKRLLKEHALRNPRAALEVSMRSGGNVRCAVGIE